VVQGAQAHKDNTGSEGIIHENCVQTMSAGTGIMHSEFNVSKTEPFHSYQIWVYPKELNVKPRHEAFNYQPADKLNKICLALLAYKMNLSGNGVYIHCVSGNIAIDTYTLNAGDALGVYETELFTIKSSETAELIFVEVPMHRGVKI
jgi:redox-sensitive bicupin YhaK (pirin superfamily)